MKSILHVEFTRLEQNILRKVGNYQVGNYPIQFTNILREVENLRKSILYVEFTRLEHKILRKVGNYPMQFTNILRGVGNLYFSTLTKIPEKKHFFCHVQVRNIKDSLYTTFGRFVMTCYYARSILVTFIQND